MHAPKHSNQLSTFKTAQTLLKVNIGDFDFVIFFLFRELNDITNVNQQCFQPLECDQEERRHGLSVWSVPSIITTASTTPHIDQDSPPDNPLVCVVAIFQGPQPTVKKKKRFHLEWAKKQAKEWWEDKSHILLIASPTKLWSTNSPIFPWWMMVVVLWLFYGCWCWYWWLLVLILVVLMVVGCFVGVIEVVVFFLFFVFFFWFLYYV